MIAHNHKASFPPALSVFRTFWSIFLVLGMAAVAVGGFVSICAASLTNHKLYKAGGALQLCGGKETRSLKCDFLCVVLLKLETYA